VDFCMWKGEVSTGWGVSGDARVVRYVNFRELLTT
jgi:hypothetical protein